MAEKSSEEEMKKQPKIKPMKMWAHVGQTGNVIMVYDTKRYGVYCVGAWNLRPVLVTEWLKRREK